MANIGTSHASRRARVRALALVTAIGTGAALGCGGPPAAAREAERRLGEGDMEGAEAIVARELLRDPDEPYLWDVQIRIHLARGDARTAVDAYRRFRAARGGKDDERVLRGMVLMTLWQGLRSPSPEVRRASARAVEKLELERLAEEVSRLLGDDDDTVRATAAVAILRGHPDAPAILQDSLSSESPEARVVALEGLSRKVGRHARVNYLDAARDPDERVRAAAVRALGAHGDAADAAILSRLAVRDPSGPVRAAALRALSALDPRGRAPLAREALGDRYLGARLAALELLTKSAGADLDRDLRTAAAGPDPYVALRAGVILARRGDRRPGFAALERALSHASWPVRAAALNAVAEIADESAASLARPLGADAEPGVRLAVARALERAGRAAEAIPILAAALALEDETWRLGAATDLARIGDPRGSQALVALATVGSPRIRSEALAALPPHHDAVLGALADPSGLVRIVAAERLGTRFEN